MKYSEVFAIAQKKSHIQSLKTFFKFNFRVIYSLNIKKSYLKIKHLLRRLIFVIFRKNVNWV